MQIPMVFAVLAAGSCFSGVPPSIKMWAAELPARADGQYASLEDAVRKQLVMKDALLECRIDLAESKSEQSSAACRCAESAKLDWIDDCRGWLGVHAPQPTAAAPRAPTPAAPFAPVAPPPMRPEQPVTSRIEHGTDNPK